MTEKRKDDPPDEEAVAKRKSEFVEKLSLILVIGAFLGGFIVLLDIRFTLTLWNQVIAVGKDGFSPEVKGVVLQSMLITGFAAVVGFWLGTTKQGQDQAQSVSRIAETVPVAAAVAASVLPGGNPIPVQPVVTETVNVVAENATLTEKPKE